MTAAVELSRGDEILASFHAENPDFDLMGFDFHSPQARAHLKLEPGRADAVLAKLALHQRVLRIAPEAGAAKALIDGGYRSAHEVAAVPDRRFVGEMGDRLPGGPEQARDVHRRAVAVKAFTEHLVANLHQTVGSALFRAQRAIPLDSGLASYYEGIPSYQDLFGSLDYCKCAQSASIFGPPAYFLDLMRVTDQYITYPNTTKAENNIPTGYKLEERRPDLFELALTPANADDPVPTLRIVNEVLARRIGAEQTVTSGTATAGTARSVTLGAGASGTDNAYAGMMVMVTAGTGVGQCRRITSYAGATKLAQVESDWAAIPDTSSAYRIARDPYQVLATAPYPFNLPANLPLTECRLYLQPLDTSLAEIFGRFAPPAAAGMARAGAATQITLAQSASANDGAYAGMTVTLTGGAGAGQARQITAYAGAGRMATVSPAWTTAPTASSQYQILDPQPVDTEILGLSAETRSMVTTPRPTAADLAPCYGVATIDLAEMAKVPVYTRTTGLSRDQLQALLTQGLSRQEMADPSGPATALFINATGEGLAAMQLAVDDSDRANPVYRIANLSLKRLDRMSRFIRLAAILGWDFESLDWAMRSVAAAEITPALLHQLAGIKTLADQTGDDILTLCGFWSDIKTTGRGDGPHPADPFDRIFNKPAMLKGQSPYTSATPIPFDPARPMTWTVADTAGTNGVIRSRLRAALGVNDDDLTRIAAFLGQVLGATAGAVVLDLAALTQMFRVANGAKTFGLTVDEYMLLLSMIYFPGQDYHLLPPGSYSPSVAEILRQKGWVDFFAGQTLSLYAAHYVLSGNATPYFQPPYRSDDIAPFIDNLAISSEGSRLGAQSFASGQIDDGQSQAILAQLVAARFLSPLGILQNYNASYEAAAARFPLDGKSFVGPGIDEAASAAVFAALKDASPPILMAVGDGATATLSAAFTADTALDFLFPGDPDAANKRNQVRNTLLATQSEITAALFAFLFVLDATALTSATVPADQAARAFQALSGGDRPVILPHPGIGQSATIGGYDGPTRTATVTTPWATPPDSGSAYAVVQTLTSGTAQGGAVDTITLATAAPDDDAALAGAVIAIDGGTGAGQSATVLAYDGASRTATIRRGWATVPDATSTYTARRVMAQGIAAAGDSATIRLAADASPTTGAYAGLTVTLLPSGVLSPSFTPGTRLDFLFTSTGAGQNGTVAAYAGATRAVTLAAPWTTAPDATSFYQVFATKAAGTARGGSESTIVLAAGTTLDPAAVEGLTVEIRSGTGAGQSRAVASYDAATCTLRVLAPWSTVPTGDSVYAVIDIRAAGTARGGSATTVLLAVDASEDDDAYKGLDIRIVADPAADAMRAEVKATLLTVRGDIDHVAQVMAAAHTLQTGNLRQGLADFLGTTAERLQALDDLAAARTDLDDLLTQFLTPLQGGQVPAEVPPFIDALSRALTLFDGLAYSVPEIEAVTKNPAAFNLRDPSRVVLGDLQPLATFKALQSHLGVSTDALIDYFRRPNDSGPCPGPKVLALAAITGWPAAQICTLVARFWPLAPAFGDYGPSTVLGLERLAACFDTGAATGLDAGSLIRLQGLAGLALTDAQGQLLPDRWQSFLDAANLVLAAVSARFEGADFDAVDAKLVSALDEQRRDALLGYAIWLLHARFPSIVSAEALYEYLLIDVQMSGCDTTSYIAQAIASAQLYMQRCRMMLEPGVTDLSDIPDVWWQWLGTYRIWEANRRIFLYPENYLNPALRSTATPQFRQLADALLQTDITEKTVSSAYQDYFYQFEQVANLAVMGSYAYKVAKPGTSRVYAQGQVYEATINTVALADDSSPLVNAYAGMTIRITAGTGQGQVNGIASYDPTSLIARTTRNWTTIPDNTSAYVIEGEEEIDTLYVVARTTAQPFVFYWRMCDGRTGWTPWAEIKLTINSPLVNPVVAYGKLMLFWAETKTVDGSKISANSSDNTLTAVSQTQSVGSSALKVSRLEADGSWTPPQTVTEDLVFSYLDDYRLDANVAAMFPDAKQFDPTNVFWQKCYPLRIPSTKFTDPARYPNGEQIFVAYGFGSKCAKTSAKKKEVAPAQAISPQRYQLQDAAYQSAKRYNALLGSQIDTQTGYVPLRSYQTVDGSLNTGTLDVTLLNSLEDPNQFTRPYCGRLNRDSGQFGIDFSDTWNVVLDNFVSDDFPHLPLGTTGALDLPLLTTVAGRTASMTTVKNRPCTYVLDNGDEAFLVRSSDTTVFDISESLIAMAQQENLPPGQFYVKSQPFTLMPPPLKLNTLTFSFSRLTTAVAKKLAQRMMIGGIPALLTLDAQRTTEPPFSRLGPTAAVVPPATDVLDFNGAYGLYFWEVFFHAPFLVASSLGAAQRFEEAKGWYEYLFNPTQQPSEGDDGSTRYWRFLPFRDMTIPTMTQILTNPVQIAAYNDTPFDPDAIARLRISAYAKAIVMRYIGNLLDWADFEFAKDTRESITTATNLYVMAGELLGPRPQALGPCPTPKPKSFNDIKAEYDNRTLTTGTARGGGPRTLILAAGASDRDDAYTGAYLSATTGANPQQVAFILAYDGATRTATVDVPWDHAPDTTTTYRVFLNHIPQFLIRLENSAGVIQAPVAGVTYEDAPFSGIGSYFCVPENTDLMTCWDRVETQLYKIRHCMNINGQVRTLALYAPPINPAQLIQAAQGSASGLSLAQQLNMPIPYYRFGVAVERAKALTAGVMQLGASLLAALEKKDAEQLALLRTSQEKTLLSMTTVVKQQQIEEVKQTIAGLQESLANAKARQTWYQKQIDNGLSSNEIQQIVYMTIGAFSNTMAAATRTMASIGYAVPQVGSPFAMTYGGQQVGAALTAASGVFEGLGVLADFGAQLNGTMAQHRRRAAEWQLQLDLTGYDIAQITAEIAAAQARQAIAERDLQIHMTSIAQNQAMEDFLKDKFTNQDLYQWMATRLSTLYYQTYALALDLARSAQRAYQYETDSDQSFVNFSYWDSGRRGLLAGEGLMLALNQMDKAYFDKNGRRLEIEKTVSLLQTNPRALLELIETGECLFEFPEKLFDDDYPGHYARKIDSVTVSIPALLGPAQNIRATLTQLGSQILVKPDLGGVKYLLGVEDAELPGADVMRSDWWVNQQITLSTGTGDSGMFEPQANDGRFKPFEGTGAVSTWRLSLPKAANPMDFDSIGDVVVALRYTALDGGGRFRQEVLRLPPMKTRDATALWPMAQRFPAQWHQLFAPPADPTRQVLAFSLEDFAPRAMTKVRVTGLHLQLSAAAGVRCAGQRPYLQLALGKAAPLMLNPDAGGGVTRMFDSPLALKDVGGAGTLAFVLANTPDGLKTSGTTKLLSPQALTDVTLILMLEGEVQWS